MKKTKLISIALLILVTMLSISFATTLTSCNRTNTIQTTSKKKIIGTWSSIYLVKISKEIDADGKEIKNEKFDAPLSVGDDDYVKATFTTDKVHFDGHDYADSGDLNYTIQGNTLYIKVPILQERDGIMMEFEKFTITKLTDTELILSSEKKDTDDGKLELEYVEITFKRTA